MVSNEPKLDHSVVTIQANSGADTPITDKTAIKSEPRISIYKVAYRPFKRNLILWSAMLILV
jgi:hypothetical protein